MSEGDARAEIDRLLASYALVLDARDIADCTNLFEDGAELVVGERTYAGYDALRRFFDRSPRGIHLLGPALVDVAADGSTATAWQSFLFVANGSNAINRGMYRDVMACDGQRWRFRRREIELYPGGN